MPNQDLNDFFPTDDVDDVLDDWIQDLLGAVVRAEYANTESITATKELNDSDCQLQIITPSGANRTVEFAPEATTNHLTLIVNPSGATYDVLVKDDSGGTTYCTLDAGEWVMGLPDGTSWNVIYSGNLGAGVTFASSAETLTGTETTKAVNPDTLNDIVTRIPKSGDMMNGKFSVTVSTNNLVVALKTLAGNDASAADPIYININGTIRTITAALSITVTAGTNYFNAGAAETATLLVPYFIYAVWDSNSSAVALTISRKSHWRLVSETSGTTTNEDHIFNYSNFTTTDDLVNIGYFEAYNSGTASYNWSVPTFDSSNLRHQPTFISRIMSWTPTFVGFSAAPTDLFSRYQVLPHILLWIHRAATNGTSNATNFTFTMPFTPKAVTNDSNQGIANYVDNGAAAATPGRIAFLNSAANVASVFTNMASGTWTASAGKRIGGMQWTTMEI